MQPSERTKMSKRSKPLPQAAKDTIGEEEDENLEFLSSVTDLERRADFLELHKLIRRLAPDLNPTDSSHGIVGYGEYHYKYASGREGNGVKINLSNNKNKLAMHCCGLRNGAMVVEAFKDRLGKCRVGKCCVRFKRLRDLNHSVLEELVSAMAVCDTME